MTTYYCTVDEIQSKNALILDGKADNLFDPYIKYAYDFINDRLRVKFVVPVADPDYVIRQIAARLAAAEMICDNVGNDGNDEDAKQVDRLRKRALEDLDMIMEGESIPLIPNADGVIPESVLNQVRCSTLNTEPKFTKYSHRTGRLETWDPSRVHTYTQRRPRKIV